MDITKIKSIQKLKKEEVEAIQGGWVGPAIRVAWRVLVAVGAVAAAGDAIERFVEGWKNCECK